MSRYRAKHSIQRTASPYRICNISTIVELKILDVRMQSGNRKGVEVLVRLDGIDNPGERWIVAKDDILKIEVEQDVRFI